VPEDAVSVLETPEQTVTLEELLTDGPAVVIPLMSVDVLVKDPVDKVCVLVFTLPNFCQGNDEYAPADMLDSVPATSPVTYWALVTDQEVRPEVATFQYLFR